MGTYSIPGDFGDELREQARPTARLTAKDHLQRFALTLVRALVDKESHRSLRIRPDIANKTTQCHYIEARKRNLAVAPLADVPSKNTFAVAVGRRLGKVAGTRD